MDDRSTQKTDELCVGNLILGSKALTANVFRNYPKLVLKECKVVLERGRFNCNSMDGLEKIGSSKIKESVENNKGTNKVRTDSSLKENSSKSTTEKKSDSSKTSAKRKLINSKDRKSKRIKTQQKNKSKSSIPLLDENTTNSENSDGNNLFNEINWEENIEIDTSAFLDEFAPRLSTKKEVKQDKKMDVKQEKKMEVKQEQKMEETTPAIKEEKADPLETIKQESSQKMEIKQEVEIKQELKIKQEPESMEQEFKSGIKIFVMDYKSSTWNQAEISEVDWDENEVLVQYGGDCSRSEEWVAMSSQRLSRINPGNLMEPTPPVVHSQTSEIVIKPTEPSVSESMLTQENENNTESTDPCTVTTPEKLEKPKGTPEKLEKQKETPEKLEKPKGTSEKLEKPKGTPTIALASSSSKASLDAAYKRRMRNRNKTKSRHFGSRGSALSRKNWKRNFANPRRDPSLKLEAAAAKFKGKFQVGEQVLAKWSEYRMQKFPAVIKKIGGNGTYDVLFYDGFEKSIIEDHIYKTTEEEVAKYQKTNPSEADAFVDMDANSKEARRERKKKTFDDYVFVKDYIPTKKKHDKESTIKRHYFKTTLGEGATKTGSLKARRNVKKRRTCGYMKQKTLLEGIQDDKTETSSSMDIDAPPQEPVTLPPVIVDPARWDCDMPAQAKPLIISTPESELTSRSVVIPDKLVPNGWIKHVTNHYNQEWKAFLFSPHGYIVNTPDDLCDYYKRMAKATPKIIDFLFNKELIPQLIEQQKDLVATEKYQIWIKKPKGKPGRKPGPLKSRLPANFPGSLGRVKTLLPKYRLEPYTTTPTSSEPENDVWKCVKEGCDKKFRKESLLQMHIKHYHLEFKALVGSAPNMVDLALARSESVHSEAASTKSPLPPIKRLLPKTPTPTTSNLTHSEDININFKPESENVAVPPLPLAASPSTPVSIRQDKNDQLLSTKRPYTIEEKKASIKTMLPCRQIINTDSPSTLNYDSDDIESEDDTKIFKPIRVFKRNKFGLMTREDSNGRENNYSFPHHMKYLKKKMPSLDKLHVQTDSNERNLVAGEPIVVVTDSYEEEKPSPTEYTADGVVIERLRSEEVINCTCGFREEDGLMIQCDVCMCWQHGLCNSFETDSDVPEQYVCYICRNPAKVRESKKYSYALHYLTQGKLPSFSFRTKNDREIKQRETVLKRCYEISEGLHEIRNVDRSLRAKLNIAERPDHPKLYLWAKSWAESSNTSPTNGKHGKLDGEKENHEDKSYESDNKIYPVPVPPEAQIEPEECRLRLLDHVDDYLQQMDDRLTSLQTQIAALESQDPDLSSNVASDRLTKQTVQMLLRDLKTVQKVAAIS